MRQQSALCDADEPIVLVTKDDELRKILRGMRVIRTYPDGVDADGNWIQGGVFKIEIARVE